MPTFDNGTGAAAALDDSAVQLMERSFWPNNTNWEYIEWRWVQLRRMPEK